MNVLYTILYGIIYYIILSNSIRIFRCPLFSNLLISPNILPIHLLYLRHQHKYTTGIRIRQHFPNCRQDPTDSQCRTPILIQYIHANLTSCIVYIHVVYLGHAFYF